MIITDPCDADALLKDIRESAVHTGMQVTELGFVGKYPLLLVEPKATTDEPHCLIGAGFHGEEPAGPWAVAKYLHDAAIARRLITNVSFLPLVNPTGFCVCRRTNDWGENPNSGFCHIEKTQNKISIEGRILLNHLPRLKECAKGGFLSLHEDCDETMFYIYTFEATSFPGPFTQMLRSTEAHFFNSRPDGLCEGANLKDGVAFCHCDGSFEDFLFHEGSPRTACTETPGKLDLELRINANVALIDAFIRFNANEGNK